MLLSMLARSMGSMLARFTVAEMRLHTNVARFLLTIRALAVSGPTRSVASFLNTLSSSAPRRNDLSAFGKSAD